MLTTQRVCDAISLEGSSLAFVERANASAPATTSAILKIGLFIRDVGYRRAFKIALDLAAQNIFSAVERLFLTVGEGAKASGVNFIEYSVYLDLQLIAFTAVDLIAYVLLVLLAALKPCWLLDCGLGAARAEKAEERLWK